MKAKNIVLIGMPGSGKSTVGVLLAKMLGMGFVDTDLLIQQREGALLQDLINDRGVEGFLDAEERAICSATSVNCVVAPGGSAVCRPAIAAHMKSEGSLVYLRLSLEAVEARIRNLATRGIAMSPGETLADVFHQRTPLYQQYADYTVDCDGKSAVQIAEEIASIFS